MAATNKPRGGPRLYETAFDSKGHAKEDGAEPNPMLHKVLYSNGNGNGASSGQRGSFANENCCRSSTGSSSSSSHGSNSSTPQHVNLLVKALRPKSRQWPKMSFSLGRSKSSDISRLVASTRPEQVAKANKMNGGPRIESIPSSRLKSSASVSISSFDNSTDSSKNAKNGQKSTLKYNNPFKRSDSMPFTSSNIKSAPVQKNQKTNQLLVHNLLMTSSDSPKGGRNLDSPKETDSPPTGSFDNNNQPHGSEISLDCYPTQKGPVFSSEDIRRESPQQLQSPRNDIRPANDYDTPWDMNKRLSRVVTEIINTPTGDKPPPPLPGTAISINSPSSESVSKLFVALKSPIESPNLPLGNDEREDKERQENATQVEVGVDPSREKPRETRTQQDANEKTSFFSSSVSASISSSLEAKESRRRFSLPIGNGSGSLSGCGLGPGPGVQASSNPSRVGLRLELANDIPANESWAANASIRKKPTLNFGCPILAGLAEDVDMTIALEKQGWYHGSITRLDAENLLRSMREGSYLVRNCESARQDYSLSLKSAKGFMHMKIVKQSDGKYVLGVFSKPFKNIPEMIHHYSVNKLPIRGAEHMSLLYPVIDQLL